MWALLPFVLMSCAGAAAPGKGRPGAAEGPGRAKVTARKQSTENAFYFFTMAQMLKDAGDVDGAIEHYKKAIELDQSSPVLYSDLAHLYLARRNTDLALELLEKAIEVDPDHQPSRILLGELYSVLKRDDEAVREYERASAKASP